MIRLILIFLLAMTQGTLAQSGSTDLRDMLRAIHLDPGFRQNLRERGYTGERFEVMIDHTRQLYADNAIIDGILRKIDATLASSGNRANAAFFERLDQTMTAAYGTGLTRLGAAERRRLFATDFGFINALPARDCTRAITGKLPPDRSGRLFDAYLVQLAPAQIADYYSLLRKATRLGLARGAVPRTLSADEARRAEEAIFPLVDTMIGKQKNAKALYAAWSRGPKATAKYACTFTKLFGHAALSLRGGTGDLAMLYLMR
ncbi:MAG: hypothetical protein LJE68_12690 [Rhodobacter sp.]|nr:hypothetical protein [Rhodobacter sp.]